MFPAYIKKYLISALESGPNLLEIFLKDVPLDSPLWDDRNDPERFTLREVVAHLADWEPVCRGRIERCRDEDKPFLPNWDEDQAAIDGNYASADPFQALETYKRERMKLVAVVAELQDDDWAKAGERENVGAMSIERQIMLIIAHDTYHLQQSAEYVGLFSKDYPFNLPDEG